MAFDRFVRRYTSALGDSAFIDELGPIPAVTNAVVFNHLLSRLLERESVSPRWAIDAQIATWRFLWSNEVLPAVTEHPDDETGEVIRHMLSDSRRKRSPPCEAWLRHSTTPSTTTPKSPCGKWRGTYSRTPSSG